MAKNLKISDELHREITFYLAKQTIAGNKETIVSLADRAIRREIARKK